MLLGDIELMRHMLVELEVLSELLLQTNFDDAIADKFKVRTIERSISIIGEAARKISDEIKSENPQVAWREIADTRNRIIHDYSGMDYDIIRSIIENDLPELEFQLKAILQDQK